MIDFYGMPRENAARAPRFPCHLEAPLREVWNAPTRLGPDGRYAPLLAADGRLFLSDKEGCTLALDAETQARLWLYPWSAPPRFLHDGQLFHWVSEEDLQVADCATGQPTRSIHALRPTEALTVGPLVVAYARDAEYGGQRLYALDWTTGRRLWSEHLPDRFEIQGVMTASRGLLLHTLVDRAPKEMVSTLVARNPDTGAELWRRAGFSIDGFAALHSDRVVGSTGSRVWCLDVRDGSTLWEADEEAGDGYLYGDHFYASGVRNRYPVFDVRTGERVRRWDLNAGLPKTLRDRGLGRVLLVSETHLYVASRVGALLAFTRDSGKYVSSHQPTGAFMRSEAVCVGGRLYYENGPWRLFCLEPKG